MVLPVPNPTKSFWIEAAASPLRNFQSTPELPAEVDVVIVGSGYTGATTAYWIHKHTLPHGTTPTMLVLEARDICGGATGRNGGQLRPHAYSRYRAWSARFGADGAHALIKHEMAHLDAFRAAMAEEGLAERVALRFGSTFDAAMTDDAWLRLQGEHAAFVADHGADADVIRDCRLIADAGEAEAFTQMKGCRGAVVHPAGQVWPYKFVHALLELVMASGRLNLQANTPVTSVSARDQDGWITVTSPRGQVRTRAVVHATNAWASHVLPEYANLIFPSISTVGSIQGAPAGFIRNTGAQHWDGNIWNYHLQLPPPHNTIVLGGAKSVITHYPRQWLKRGDDDKALPGVAEYMQTWPAHEVVGWPASGRDDDDDDDATAQLGLDAEQGGVWTGVVAPSADGFPFVGAVPGRQGHFIAAGFGGHGMPRILLSTAHLVPLVLDELGVEWTAPSLVAPYPPIPEPFVVTEERLKSLAEFDARAVYEDEIRSHEESAKTPVANGPRSLLWKDKSLDSS